MSRGLAAQARRRTASGGCGDFACHGAMTPRPVAVFTGASAAAVFLVRLARRYQVTLALTGVGSPCAGRARRVDLETWAKRLVGSGRPAAGPLLDENPLFDAASVLFAVPHNPAYVCDFARFPAVQPGRPSSSTTMIVLCGSAGGLVSTIPAFHSLTEIFCRQMVCPECVVVPLAEAGDVQRLHRLHRQGSFGMGCCRQGLMRTPPRAG